jgi:hypothetical protein
VLAWLEGTALATWTRESPSIWAYPTILTLHTVGLGIASGACAVIDLRMLGFARRIGVRTLVPLFTIMWWAFALNALTGIMLFMSDATTKGKQPVFYIKLTLIALALTTAVTMRRRMATMADGAHSIDGLRALAAASLFLWAGAITAGRLMAYL